MIKVEDVPDTVEALTAAIEERRGMQRQMVGQLWPGVLEGEIVKLNERRMALRAAAVKP